MKKFTLVLFMLMSASINFAVACSALKLAYKNDVVVAQNFDWGTKAGNVLISRAGLEKQAQNPVDNKPLHWKSKYASVAFSLNDPDGKMDRNAIVGGMNEHGLVAAILWLDEAQYPSAQNQTVLPSAQWAEYMLDNAKSVQEVIDISKKMQVLASNYFGQKVMVHLTVFDATGQSAVLEYVKGKLNIYTGKDLPIPIITNDTYPQSLKAFAKYKDKKEPKLPGGYSPISRFVLGANYINRLKMTSAQQLVPEAFNVLGYLIEPVFGDTPTDWSIVYDLNSKVIYYREIDNPQIRKISMNQIHQLNGKEYKACNIMHMSC
jgi:penicillin V acylase-like amidase (Ntn superfamily)